jgi:hypothetical protein
MAESTYPGKMTSTGYQTGGNTPTQTSPQVQSTSKTTSVSGNGYTQSGNVGGVNNSGSYGPTQKERDEMAAAAEKAAQEAAEKAAQEAAQEEVTEEAQEVLADADEYDSANAEDYANNLSDAQNEANQNALNTLQSGSNQASASEVGQSILAGTDISNTADTATTNTNNQTKTLLKRLLLALQGEEATDQSVYLSKENELSNEAQGSSILSDIFKTIASLFGGK